MVHQTRYLEKKLALALWEQKGRGLRLTQTGKLLFEVANQALSVLSQTEQMLKACSEDKQGILHIGVKWLTGIIDKFMQQIPGVDLILFINFYFQS